jgi:Ca2+-binding RTX toxin-like protein
MTTGADRTIFINGGEGDDLLWCDSGNGLVVGGNDIDRVTFNALDAAQMDPQSERGAQLLASFVVLESCQYRQLKIVFGSITDFAATGYVTGTSTNVGDRAFLKTMLFFSHSVFDC